MKKKTDTAGSSTLLKSTTGLTNRAVRRMGKSRAPFARFVL